jgi:hypothetical protein
MLYLVHCQPYKSQIRLSFRHTAFFWRNIAMKKLMLAAASFFFAAGLACAQAPAPAPASPSKAPAPMASTCAAKAVDKSGKPLAGAAKASFMKKCEADTKGSGTANCEAKAVGKNGKPLAGAAKTSFMKKCEADAGK